MSCVWMYPEGFRREKKEGKESSSDLDTSESFNPQLVSFSFSLPNEKTSYHLGGKHSFL